MKFSVFNGMPYGRTRMPGNKWPVPNQYFEPDQARRAVAACLEEVAMEDELGFDWIACAEHHYSPFNLAPNVTVLASALTQHVKRAKIAILGALIPLTGNPVRIAEEYAMIDMMSHGRVIAGFAVGGGPEAFNYNLSSAKSRRRFWEGIDLVVRAWTDDGPFEHEGPNYPLRYVNIWPKTRQKPHPPVWIPGSLSIETMEETAKRGFDYFLSSRVHGAATRAAANRFADVIKAHGGTYHPFRMGVLLSVYVSETDESARAEASEGVWYFLRNCLKGHLRRIGRTQTFGPGIPSQSVRSWEQFLRNSKPGEDRLGDASSWEELDAGGSIIAGSPATVRKRLWELIELAGVGNFLIQFHFGNMKAEYARKSMRLFAEQVLPELRKDSAALFARGYPQLAEIAGAAR